MSPLLVAFSTHTTSGDSCPQVASQPWCLAARPVIAQASCGLWGPAQGGARPSWSGGTSCPSNTLSSRATSCHLLSTPALQPGGPSHLHG